MEIASGDLFYYPRLGIRMVQVVNDDYLDQLIVTWFDRPEVRPLIIIDDRLFFLNKLERAIADGECVPIGNIKTLGQVLRNKIESDTNILKVGGKI